MPNLSVFDSDSNILLWSLATPGGVAVEEANVIQIVADGAFSYSGPIARAGESYQVSGTIPEPATMSLLAIGGVAALIRRRRR